MKKKFITVLLVILIVFLSSCTDKAAILAYDRYSSCEPIRNNFNSSDKFDNTFKAIERYYKGIVRDGFIIRVYVYDEIVECPKGGYMYKTYNLIKAEVVEIYFVGESPMYELESGDNIWLYQAYCTDEEENSVVIYDNGTPLMIPNCEYLIYTNFLPYCGERGVYLNTGIFRTTQLGVVPLTITQREYAKVLKNNGFVYVEHDDICEKAIEKYINGNK